MASIAILVIMAGLAAYQFFKGTFIKAFATFMAALCSAIVAFAWFEQIARLLIQRKMIPNSAQFLAFIVLFVVAFAILQTLASTLLKQPIDLGLMPERVGRVVFGLLAGIVVSGCLLAAAAIAPLPAGFPYQRFDPASPDVQKPNKPFLNPDGFISRWFAVTSRGSLGSSKSFDVLHAGLLDELSFNRLAADKKISVLTEPGSIEIPEKAAWPAPAGLKDNSGAPVSALPDHDLIMVRVGFTGRLLNAGGSFTPGQLRLICKQVPPPAGGKKDENIRFQGSAVNAYPIGYLKGASQLQSKGLNDQITLTSQDISAGTRWIDFAFQVRNNFEPVAVAFKANIIAEVPPMVTAEQAPKPVTFIQSAGCATGFAKISPATGAKIYGLELAGSPNLFQGTRLIVADTAQWTSMQTKQSVIDARFEQDQITCVQTELVEPNKPQGAESQPAESVENRLPQMFKPASGYSVLTLKCNNPAGRSQITGEQLPSLIDSAGVIHRACGVIAAGKIEGKTTFEADYCPEKITFNNDGAAALPFPEKIWLAEKAESVSELYVLFLVKPGTVIMSVRPADAAAGAAFEESECFSVN